MMVVPGVPRAVIVIELPIGMDDSGDHSTIGKLFQIPVDCWQADGFKTVLKGVPDLFRAEKAWLIRQGLQNGPALRGLFEPQFFKNGSEVSLHGISANRKWVLFAECNVIAVIVKKKEMAGMYSLIGPPGYVANEKNCLLINRIHLIFKFITREQSLFR